MFGRDGDNQDQTDQPAVPITDAGALNAAMPDPIAPSGFNIPANSPVAAPVNDQSAPVLPATPVESSTDVTATTPDELVSIKQEALEHLSPLVSHLEQTPEEKFRTTMMMIQASDNKDLVKDAFEAAKNIGDDKSRAQALLDVINEINYFTQHEN